MVRRIIYPSLQQPVLDSTQRPEAVLESKWHQPWSIPVRQKIIPALAIALIASGLITPPTPDELEPGSKYESQWHQPLSEPSVKSKIGLATNKQQFLAWSTFTPVSVLVPITEPVEGQPTFQPTTIYQPVTAPTFNFIETITADKWVFPWSEPVRQKIGLATRLQQTTAYSPAFAETVTVDKWIYPWSDPSVKSKAGLRASQQQFLAFQLDSTQQPEQVTESRWHQPWSEPSVKSKAGLAANQQQFLAWSGFTPSVVVTFTPIPEPVEGQVIFPQTTIYEPEAGTPLQIINPTPFLTPAAFTSAITPDISFNKRLIYQSKIEPVLSPETEIIEFYESRWHYPWSEPVRQKIGLATHLQQAFTTDLTTIPASNVPAWLYPWSEPVRQKIGLRSYLQQTFTTDPSTVPTSNVATWLYPFSEPVRSKRISTAQIPEITIGTQPTVSFSFYNWLSEPVRQKVGLPAYLQRAFTTDTVGIPSSSIPAWLYPWSEPVRQKIGLAARLQQTIAQSPSFAETITYDKWGYQWTDPVRTKRTVTTHLQQAFTTDPAVIPTSKTPSWFSPLSEPVRIKRGLLASDQQSLIWGNFAPPPFTTIIEPVEGQPTFSLTTIFQPETGPISFTPETITEPKWGFAWSEPVRTKIGLATKLQQTIAYRVEFAEVVTVDKWIYPWSEPSVKSKAGLRAALQQFLAFQLDKTQQPEQVTESRWHQPWSEPVRIKRGLLASDQQFLAAISQVPEVVTPDKWAFQWSEPPVKIKSGLFAFLQRFFTAPDELPPVVTVTITLSATEVNTDSAFFGVVTYNPAVSASVSIKEIPIIRTAAASIEQQEAIDRAASSIKEEPAVDAAAASIKET